MLSKNKERSSLFKEKLDLRDEPIALKYIEDDFDLPKDAVSPKKDLGKHIALCQAYTLVRRELTTFYLEKEDHWCWNPLVGFGLVDCDEGTEAFEIVCSFLGMKDIETARKFFATFPRLPQGKYKGVLLSPLCKADFEPDVTIVYCDNHQLRSMVWSVKKVSGRLVSTELDAIDSCIYTSVPPFVSGEYRVTLPDFGETERAMADPEEIILSIPKGHIDELLENLYPMPLRPATEIELDFPRPPFYNDLFDMWGLEKGKDWAF